MAPEWPPYLVIFDARTINGALKGSVQYVEPGEQGKLLRVRWSVESQPEDFLPIGGGVAYVYAKHTEVIVRPESRDASADHLGASRYRWTEGLQFGVPKLMFILILPQGYTLTNPAPVPTGTKRFQERLALYWILKANDQERTDVKWTVEEFHGDLESEIVRINNDFVAAEPSEPIEIPLI